MSEEYTKSNAFVFKALINNEYKMCVCPRIDGQWNEQEIFYVDNPVKELYDSLDETKFHVIFVVYERDEKGFWIKPGSNPTYLRSDTAIAKDMYSKGEFFTTIEKGYKQIYEQQPSGEGFSATTSEEESV